MYSPDLPGKTPFLTKLKCVYGVNIEFEWDIGNMKKSMFAKTKTKTSIIICIR
jgi:hypothetical protein